MTIAHMVLFGVPIDGYTTAGALDRISELVTSGRTKNRSHQVATVNVDFLVNALDDPAVMRILQRNDLNLADGMPLVWASRMLGPSLPERVAGADLVPRLASLSAARGTRIHLFGARPGVAERARAKMLTDHPEAVVTADGGPSRIDPTRLQPEIVDSIIEAAPDVLCVALGNPKQELFIDTYRSVLQCPVMIGVGGSLDMLVGDKRRAPGWMQRVGAEWAFRALQEPGRLGRRYVRDIAVFGPQLMSYVGATRQYRGAGHLAVWIEGGGRLVVSPTQIEKLPWPDVDLAGIESVEIRLAGVNALDPRSHARLVGLIRRARTERTPVHLDEVSDSLRRCIRDFGTTAIIADSGEPSVRAVDDGDGRDVHPDVLSGDE
jgi:N-acetylglucosaminyldiphosphoundecaprenol N-acetyl-beta-D-mannosaminyltransferase